MLLADDRLQGIFLVVMDHLLGTLHSAEAKLLVVCPTTEF
jgi:hypothetical protein